MRNLMLIGTAALALFAIPAFARQAENNKNLPKADRQSETVIQSIPASTTYVFDRNVGPGRILKTGTGEAGKASITTIRTYIGGKLVKETHTTKIIQPASNIVVAMGLEGYRGISRSGSFVASKVLTMSASAYISNEGSMNPTSHTATGRECEYGIVAVDPRVVPLNSLMYIEGYGFGVAADTGGAIRGNKIDLCMETRHQMNDWGRRSVQVHVLKVLTDEQLKQMGVTEGTTVDVKDELLAADLKDDGSGPQPLPADKTQNQANPPNDPASTPGRDPSEPAISGIHAPDVSPSKPTVKPTVVDPTVTKPAVDNTTIPAGFRKMTVTKDGVNVRSKPNTDSSVVSMLLADDSVMVGGVEGGWVPVVTSTGGTGWVRADLLGISAPSETVEKPVVEKPVVKPSTKPKHNDDSNDEPATHRGSSHSKASKEDNSSDRGHGVGRAGVEDAVVRTGSSTTTKKLTTLGKGEPVTIVGEDGDFYKVKLHGGDTGYVRKDKLSVGNHKPKAIAEDKPAKSSSKKGDRTDKSDRANKSGSSSKKESSKKESSSKKEPSKSSSSKKKKKGN